MFWDFIILICIHSITELQYDMKQDPIPTVKAPPYLWHSSLRVQRTQLLGTWVKDSSSVGYYFGEYMIIRYLDPSGLA